MYIIDTLNIAEVAIGGSFYSLHSQYCNRKDLSSIQDKFVLLLYPQTEVQLIGELYI